VNGGYYDAYQLIRKHPIEDEYHIRVGRGSEFSRCLSRAIQDFGLDRNQYRLTDRGLYNEFYDVLIEIAEEHGTDLSEDEFNNKFRSKKGDLFSNWLGKPPEIYTVIFPIMIRHKHFPDEIQLYGSKAEQIDQERWDELINTAIEPEDSNLDIIIDKLPNNIQSDHPIDRIEWTYLKINIEARDEFYSLYRAMDLVELRFAEINFFEQLWVAGMPQPAGSDRVPYEKWSRFQKPPFYVVFREEEYQSITSD
jgi:hypothetical protein